MVEHAASESGEHRFRWLHAKPGRAGLLHEAALDAHGGQAWVRTAEEVVDAGWLGPVVTDVARTRLGDVALIARGGHAFSYRSLGGKSRPSRLRGRHGSLTPAEMLVPLLTYSSLGERSGQRRVMPMPCGA